MSDIILEDDGLRFVGSEIRISTPDGDTMVMSVKNGNLVLGGAGRDGDLMLTDRAGNLTIGLNGESGSLHLGGVSEDGDLTLYNNQAQQTVHVDGAKGDMTVTGTVQANRVVQTSDATLKTACTPIENALATLSGITGYRYRFTAAPQEERLGFLAQDLQHTVPEAVVDQSPHLSVDQSSLVPILVEAVKDLSAQVASLRARLDAQHDKASETDI